MRQVPLPKGGGVLAPTAVVALLGPASALASHGVTAPISVDPAGLVGDSESNYADMTPDGRFVSFVSAASNLVPGDTNGVGDVFVRDRRTGLTERVSVGLKGVEGNGDSNFLGIATETAISDDGRYVAFKSEASNLVRGDRNGATDVFVRDRVAGTTERISVDSAENEAGGGGDDPAISPDGRYVAFVTSDFDSEGAAISPDGRFVSFASFASDLVAESGGDPLLQDAYVRDRTAGSTERVSVASDHSNAKFGPFDTHVATGPVSADGRVSLITTNADNLFPGDDNNDDDVFFNDHRPAADLALEKADAPDPVEPRGSLSYSLTTTNNGTGPAPHATVVDVLPAGVTFASASSGCTHSAGKVECDLGTLEGGASRTVTIVVTPKRAGTITNTATVGSDAPDPNPADNAMTITTTIAK